MGGLQQRAFPGRLFMSDRFSARRDAFAHFNVDEFATVSRRTLLRGLSASALLTTTGSFFTRGLCAAPAFSSNPFTLGVASGDPAPDGFVLWTKIAPRPLDRGGGMPMRPVEVDWAVATSDSMRQVVRKGAAVAHPELGHAVHVEVDGLEPARDYFYQFAIGGVRSQIGRSRTLPPAGAAVGQVRIGLVGCQAYDSGFFTAYRHVAKEQFDFVYHYGDYIYEHGMGHSSAGRVVPRDFDETFTLDDYRYRYGLYKLDLDLQAAHASAPFVMSFDDHEVSNDWAGDWNTAGAPAELFALRRAAAFQAWYEHLPVRKAQLPRGPDIQGYRRFAVGDLITMNVLDTRQYRTPPACGSGRRHNCAEAFEPHRTMMGETQERWLYDGFKTARRTWNVLAQQVTMMRNDADPDPDKFLPNMDMWDGATVARDRLFAAIEDAKVANLIVLSGDIHSNWAGELKKDFLDEKSATLGVEFVATSITSGGDGVDINESFKQRVAKQPYVKFFNGQRGYVRHVVTPARWQADFQVIDKVSVPDGRMSTRKSLVVESGKSAIA
jgi:alkaline phosphatase D